MKVILDFQACQSASRFRGVGRGTKSLQLKMAQLLLSHGHEVICVLNKAMSEGLDALKQSIEKAVPGARVIAYEILEQSVACHDENLWRQFASRLLREHAIARLEPEFVHIPALLADGWEDETVGSVDELGVHIPTSLTHYDLIPLVMDTLYLPEGRYRDYYLRKIEYVKNADLLLAISDYARKEAVDFLGLPDENVVNMFFAADESFSSYHISDENILNCLSKFSLKPGFFLYAPGGFDPRKNVDRLLEAYSILPQFMREKHQLVIASKIDPEFSSAMKWKAGTFGLTDSEVIFTGYITDEELMSLYKSCLAYVFPSLHEGFGLPALEAMRCGAPVIASNCTSIPEVIEMNEALFDPYDPHSIANKMLQVAQDIEFRSRLIVHAAVQPDKFSWDRTAEIAVTALERKSASLRRNGWKAVACSDLPCYEDLLTKLSDLTLEVNPSESDIDNFSKCFKLNNEVFR